MSTIMQNRTSGLQVTILTRWFVVTTVLVAISAAPIEAYGQGPTGRGIEKSTNGLGQAIRWSLNPNGKWEVNFHGVPILTADYQFRTSKWKWTETKRTVSPVGSDGSDLQLAIPAISTEINGKVAAPRPNVAICEFDVRVADEQQDIIGGGIEFLLHRNATPLAGLKQSEPVLLAKNGGWKWEIAPGQFVAVTFEPAPIKVYFEKGSSGRIRAFLVGESEAAGTTRRVKMTITLPEGARRTLSEEEEYGPVDLARWHKNVLLPGASPVDLRYLNHPPGTHGFVRADGNRLVFEDGTPAKFWGINVMAYALFSSNEQIQLHAQRLAKLGFNLVRLHHHDTTAWVSPTVIDKDTDSSRKLSPKGIDKVDYWIKCLSDNGIYVWLDLHSYRQFKEGDRVTEHGEIATFSELNASKGKPGEAKGFCQYDPALQKLMAEFQENYLSHVNPYTKRAYKEDPAIVGLLITNENDLTQHYGMRAVPNSGNSVLNRLFEEQVSTFAQRTGLEPSKIRQPWAPGPAKLFLNDQEHRFYSVLLQSLRKLDVKAPVAVGNMWGDNPFSSLPALTTGDLIDVHRYDGAGNLRADPRYESNMASWIGCDQVAGKPLTVSEWNFVASQQLAVDRFNGPLFVASIAALQGWDGLMMYGYSQMPLKGGAHRAGVWNTINDPAMLALMPNAALAYRQGHVSPAKKTYCLTLTPQQLFNSGLNPDTCPAARTLMEQSRFTIAIPETRELDWLHAAEAEPDSVRIDDPQQSFLSDEAESVRSDTGELERNWTTGSQTINTPMTQAAQGGIGGRKIELADVSFEVETPNAAVAVTALDGKPIRESSKILVTSVARVWKETTNKKGGSSDVFSEPVRGFISIRAQAGLRVVPLMGNGAEGRTIDTASKDDAYRIRLDGMESHWTLLRSNSAQ